MSALLQKFLFILLVVVDDFNCQYNYLCNYALEWTDNGLGSWSFDPTTCTVQRQSESTTEAMTWMDGDNTYLSWSNYTVDVDIELSTGGSSSWPALLYYVTDVADYNENFYALFVVEDYNELVWYRVVDGSWSSATYISVSPTINIGTIYHLKVVLVDDKQIIYWDNSPVSVRTVEDSGRDAGSVGFRTYHEKCIFRNLYITGIPTFAPTKSPTIHPTNNPTNSPTTSQPTHIPTNDPTNNPTDGPTTYQPTNSPTTVEPTNNPSTNPTEIPTINPSLNPTETPTKLPTTQHPTNHPTTTRPTNSPSTNPTKMPTAMPTNMPTQITTDVREHDIDLTDTTQIFDASTDGNEASSVTTHNAILRKLLYFVIGIAISCTLALVVIIVKHRKSRQRVPAVPVDTKSLDIMKVDSNSIGRHSNNMNIVNSALIEMMTMNGYNNHIAGNVLNDDSSENVNDLQHYFGADENEEDNVQTDRNIVNMNAENDIDVEYIDGDGNKQMHIVTNT